MLHANLSLLAVIALLSGESPISITSYTVAALSKQNSNISATENYWTPDRLRQAAPMPLPKTNIHSRIKISLQDLLQQHNDKHSGEGAPPSASMPSRFHQLFIPMSQLQMESKNKTIPRDAGTNYEQFSSSRLVPLTADQAYPYTTVGKLFFTIPGKGDYVCSAAVLRPRIILTAAHCVHDGSGSARGFYTNWLFVPAYRDGIAPFQSWSWSFAVVASQWAASGGHVPNAADYAMLELQDRKFDGTVHTIGSVTGYLGYLTQSLARNHVHMLGYPCNLDSCQKMHQVTTQSMRAVAPGNVEYGSDMGDGSSGSPWVQNFGAPSSEDASSKISAMNKIVGLTSYSYTDTTTLAEGSSILNGEFTHLLATVCAHKVGNCR